MARARYVASGERQKNTGRAALLRGAPNAPAFGVSADMLGACVDVSWRITVNRPGMGDCFVFAFFPGFSWTANPSQRQAAPNTLSWMAS